MNGLSVERVGWGVGEKMGYIKTETALAEAVSDHSSLEVVAIRTSVNLQIKCPTG